MPRLRTVYRCTACGAASPKWAGRCPACEAWNALVEDVEEVGGPVKGAPALAPASPALPITEAAADGGTPRPTGVPELDRVLGGGLVAGSVTLVGGEPGIGKSTLLLEVAAHHARATGRALYVSAEESRAQVHARAARMGALEPELYLQAETSLPAILAAVDETGAKLLVVDSIQTVSDPELGPAPGSVVQVRECAHVLVQEAKRRGTAVLLVGHVTKDGNLAGPRLLEHVVDTVLAFEGDRHHALRLLRAQKHRFGPTTELGLFEMDERGLKAVPDPSGLFLADRRSGVSGSAVVPTVEGQRPLLVEVQALTVRSPLAQPRRSAQGVEAGRLSLLLAVLEQRAAIGVSGLDVYVSVTGGVRLTEPGADLAVCLAVASTCLGVPLPAGMVACGEVGLGGELRQVPQTPRRLQEAARLGFTSAIVPASAPNGVAGIEVKRARSVLEALALAGLLDDAAGDRTPRR